MKKSKYLIIGGGMTADSAVRGIRSIDTQGTICLVSNETVSPYNRPPLSKGLWHGKSIEKIWRQTEKQNVDLVLGTNIVKLDIHDKCATDYLGDLYHYEKVLFATGASPRKFPYEENFVNYYRFLKDYESLKALTEEKQNFTIIGGGFIGSELAASLSDIGKSVRIIFPETWMNQRIFPNEVSNYLHEIFKAHNVEILTGISVNGVEDRDHKKLVHIKSKTGESLQIEADGVIAGLGVIPNTSLAQDSGLPIENGIKVNSYFQTDSPDVFAAGDVANYPDPFLMKNRRVEHEDHANSSGMSAGRNMAGSHDPYDHLPYFYSDLFDFGYEAVGELDSGLDITIDWEEPFKTGTLYYQRDSKVVGILLWNKWNKLDQAREVIHAAKLLSKNDLSGLI
jgi:3-phenylpropionate/trans-cinnamate dioxygenase ferredoxin reductase component